MQVHIYSLKCKWDRNGSYMIYIKHCWLKMRLWKFCPSGHSSSGSAWIHSKISQWGENNQTTRKHLKPLLQLSAVHLYAHYILNCYIVTVLNSWLCSRRVWRSLYWFKTYWQTWKLTYLFGKLLCCRYSSNLRHRTGEDLILKRLFFFVWSATII